MQSRTRLRDVKLIGALVAIALLLSRRGFGAGRAMSVLFDDRRDRHALFVFLDPVLYLTQRRANWPGIPAARVLN